ncbi:MAG: hypothetical protein JJU02_02700 [Cryomorphaceae bacterium]|nr:hypothetical protein [Cryomorphaceae bacterium]
MRLIAVLSGILLIGSLSTSCKQDDRDFEVTVLVTVQDTIPVRNASVRIFAPVEGSIIDVFANTNEFGEAKFSFDNKAFLNVHVVKGSWRKCDAIELERGNHLFEINLYPFNDPRRTCN